VTKAITPDMGGQAEQRIKYWERTEKAPAFVRVLGEDADADCPNCAGYGAVLISFCKYGPSAAPLTNKKPSTYFPGNGRFGKGWNLIEQTLALPCPRCGQQHAARQAALASVT